jgi:outer membrane scaffolding protein for murein synthesis (MipA/OmpV family)
MTKVNTAVLAMLGLFLASVYPAENGWEVELGAGILRSPVYAGSDDWYVAPIPGFEVAYSTGRLSFSASLLDGLGATYVDERYGLLASVGINFGEERDSEEYSLVVVPTDHSERAGRLLEGTPTVRGLLKADLTLGALTPIGLVGAALGYRPTTVDYGDGQERTYNGFLYSLFYVVGMPLGERLDFSALVSLEAMDRRYADAWYSLEEETAALEAFGAGAGLHAVSLAVEGNYALSRRIGMSLLAGETLLLSDAARSPYTVQRFQTQLVLEALYRFE